VYAVPGLDEGLVGGYATAMDTSVAWINDYLDRPADADTQAELLTNAGFPLEGREEVGDDTRQDFEMTSNRGDCTCHVGLAREVAALTDRTLLLPPVNLTTSGDTVESLVTLKNEATDHCPYYTARVISGIQAGPSPVTIRSRLEARGDTPRSNVVDATNFVLFELGQPTHVFDLDTLAGNEIVVRMARKGEKFLPIGEDATEIELNGTELVIADAEKPVALAGVKGGAATAVTEHTKNILVEAATFDPVMVRHTSRLHNISSDSSFRFERGVSPGQVDAAAERLCSLILETAGGELAPGVLQAGAPMPERSVVTMRTDRCRTLLGLDIDDNTQVSMLTGLGFEPSIQNGVIAATVPWHRGDIHREVDLIEEVMRMHGFDAVPVREAMTIEPVDDPAEHAAREAMTASLVADGFVETVTHSLIPREGADMWLPTGGSTREVHEARAAGVPTLRPSIISSLVRVRAHNADQGVEDLRLFELGSVFHRSADGSDHEALELGLLMDSGDQADSIRPLRGVIDHLAVVLAGMDAAVEVAPCDDLPWLSPAGRITINGNDVGVMGCLRAQPSLGDRRLLAAAIRPADLMQHVPPERAATRLPDHPAIERDISAIVMNDITWAEVERIVNAAELPHHEATTFITTWRGKGVPDGHKSVTMRLRFRAQDRTLTREEVEEPMAALLNSLRSGVNAEIRA